MFKKIIKICFFLVVFMLGAGTLVLEIIGARIISPFFGSTIFVWSSLIITTLGGLSIGYLIGGFLSKKEENEQRLFFFFPLILGFLFTLIPLAVVPVSNFSEELGMRFGPLLASLILFLPLFTLVGITTPLSVSIYSKEKTAGSAAGTLYSLGTAGSLISALFTGFFLIPLLPLSSIIYWTAILIIAPSFIGFLDQLNKKNKIILFRSVVIFFFVWAAISFGYKSPAINEDFIKIVEKSTSFYTGLKVIEFSNLRCILGGLKLYSCINIKTMQASEDFSVIKDGINPFLEKVPAGGEVLLLGGGSGMALEKIPPNVKGTMVEIDPGVIYFAEKYFELDLNKYNIIIDDSRHAVKDLHNKNKKFDLIILDVILDTKIPPHIMSVEALNELSLVLKPTGLIIVNGGVSPERPTTNDASLSSIMKTASQIFPFRKVTWRDDNNSRNIIFYFSHNEIPQTKIPEIEIKMSALALTDDFNPLDYYNLDRQLNITKELRLYLGEVALK
jgi:predicted membrane-bound spermidine synthase